MQLTENSRGDRVLTIPRALVELARRVFGIDSDHLVVHKLCRISADDLVRLERLSIQNPDLAEQRLQVYASAQLIHGARLT